MLPSQRPGGRASRRSNVEGETTRTQSKAAAEGVTAGTLAARWRKSVRSWQEPDHAEFSILKQEIGMLGTEVVSLMD